MYGKGFLGNMTENLQADCVQSRQAGFMQCFPKFMIYFIIAYFPTKHKGKLKKTRKFLNYAYFTKNIVKNLLLQEKMLLHMDRKRHPLTSEIPEGEGVWKSLFFVLCSVSLGQYRTIFVRYCLRVPMSSVVPCGDTVGRSHQSAETFSGRLSWHQNPHTCCRSR